MSITLERLRPAERQQLLERLDELAELGRLMRERGGQRPPVTGRPGEYPDDGVPNRTLDGDNMLVSPMDKAGVR